MDVRKKLVKLLREVQYLGGLEEKVADHLISNGDVFTSDKTQKFLVKADTISEEKMRELLNGPAIFHTGTESIVPIYPYQWISVKDRLPEEKGWYWVYTESKGDHAKRNNKAFYCNTGWHANGGRWNNVTHWMPLPEPPKGE